MKNEPDLREREALEPGEPACPAFVTAGLALAQIRDRRLYRADFLTFESYCRAKWHYGRTSAHHLMSAARLFMDLAATSPARKPDHESQLRPLTGLPNGQAQLVWNRATAMAGSGVVTARMVRMARNKLLGGAPEKKAAVQTTPPEPAKRDILDAHIGELLVLISKKASPDLLTKKVEELYRHLRASL